MVAVAAFTVFVMAIFGVWLGEGEGDRVLVMLLVAVGEAVGVELGELVGVALGHAPPLITLKLLKEALPVDPLLEDTASPTR